MAYRPLLLLAAITLLAFPANSDEEETLLDGINRYRASQSLSRLPENDNAECLADQIAEQLKYQDCSNSTGMNLVPAKESQFPNYAQLLAHCKLNASNTIDGAILPACVPGLPSDIVLANFTQSPYSKFLNDSKYSGAGIGSEDNWIVVVLSTSAPSGNFVKEKSASALAVGKSSYFVAFVVAFLVVSVFNC